MRYGELVTSLGTIATNLLADRLRGLETSGVVERRLGEKGGVVYGLTPWGSELREGIEALVRWSTPLMVRGPDDDSFSSLAGWPSRCLRCSGGGPPSLPLRTAPRSPARS